MSRARAGRLMIAPVRFNIAALAVHVPWPRPIGEAVVGTIFVAAFWRGVEEPVDAEKFFASTTESRVGVKDPT